MSGSQTKRARRAARVEELREVYTDDDFGLRLDADNRGRLRLQWRPDQDPALGLLGLERVRRLLDEMETEWVLYTRADGASWGDVGMLLGITAEGARKRFGQVVRDLASIATTEVDA